MTSRRSCTPTSPTLACRGRLTGRGEKNFSKEEERARGVRGVHHNQLTLSPLWNAPPHSYRTPHIKTYARVMSSEGKTNYLLKTRKVRFLEIEDDCDAAEGRRRGTLTFPLMQSFPRLASLAADWRLRDGRPGGRARLLVDAYELVLE